MEEFSERILIESGRKAHRRCLSLDRGREINVHVFNSNGFGIVNLLPKRDRFSAQYFIGQILKPFSQDIPRNRLILFAEVCIHILKVLDAIQPKLCQGKCLI
jgi:hypothetical protein